MYPKGILEMQKMFQVNKKYYTNEKIKMFLIYSFESAESNLILKHTLKGFQKCKKMFQVNK